jgi:hypothetical protein
MLCVQCDKAGKGRVVNNKPHIRVSENYVFYQRSDIVQSEWRLENTFQFGTVAVI